MQSIAKRLLVGVLVATVLVGTMSVVGLAEWYYAVRFICEEMVEDLIPVREWWGYWPGLALSLTMDNRHAISTSISILNPTGWEEPFEFRFAFHSEREIGQMAGPDSCWEWTSEHNGDPLSLKAFETINIPSSRIVYEYEEDFLGGSAANRPATYGKWGGERLEGFVLIRSQTPLLQVAAVYMQRDDRFAGPDVGSGIGSSIDVEYITPFLIDEWGSGDDDLIDQ